MRETICEKFLEVKIDISSDNYVLGEKEAMTMILDNLVNNAVRYTESNR